MWAGSGGGVHIMMCLDVRNNKIYVSVQHT